MIDRFYLVTGGPSYTHLRRFDHPAHQRSDYDRLVLVQEPDGALRPSDVEAALLLPIAALIRIILAVLRVIDTG